MLAKTKTKKHPQSKIYASIAGSNGNNNGKFWQFKSSINAKAEKEAELLLYGVIGDDGFWSDVTAKEFSDELKDVEDAKTIRVRINSPGGDVFAGQAIYSMLKRCKAEVIGYVDGLAASIASLVLMACDTVIMPKNSMLMIHKPWTATAGNANDMGKVIETLNKVEEAMLTAYVDKTGMAEAEIKELLAAETWLTASDAVAKGFADEIEETEVSACMAGNILEINGQKINIKNYKNFNAEWYKNTESRPAGEGKPANTVPTVININVVTNENMKGKTNMDLEKMCAALGLDYDALIKAGMTEKEIKSMVSTKMQENTGDGGEDAKDQVKAEKDRVQNIIKLGEEYKAQDKAMQFVKDGKSVDDFKNELIKSLQVKDQDPIENDKKSTFGIGMTVEEARNFSFVKLLNAMTNPTDTGAQKAAEKELEFCSKAAEKYGVKNKGIIIPAEVLVTPLTTPKAVINTTVGAPLIPTTLEMGSFIELLRNKCVILSVARQLNGLVGNIDIPKQTAGASGYWVGEDTAPASSNATFDTLKLRMKTVAGNTYVTRNMLKQTTLDMEAFVREDLATALALALDKAAFYGTGSDNEPKGLSKITGINSVEFVADNPNYTELVKMETEIGLDNAAVDSMAYIVNAGTKGHCKTTQKFPTNTDGGGVIWEAGNQINGYKALVTNQVNTGDVFLGNWADFIVGLFGGLEILVDPYTYSSKGAIQVTGFQDVDFGARHAESFCMGKKKVTA